MFKSLMVVGIGLGMAQGAGAALVDTNLAYQSPGNVAANFTTAGPASWQVGSSVSTFLNSIYAVANGESTSSANFNYRYDDTSPGNDLLNRIGIGTGYNVLNGSLIFKFTTDSGLEFTGGTATVSGYVSTGGSNPAGINPRVQTGADLTVDSTKTNGFEWVGSPADSDGFTTGGDGTYTWTVDIPAGVSSFYLAIEDNGQGTSGAAVNYAFYPGAGSSAMASSIQLSATVAAVPEPAMAGLLGLGVLALHRRRRA